VLEKLQTYLSPTGVMYLVGTTSQCEGQTNTQPTLTRAGHWAALDSNDPQEIALWMNKKGFKCKVVMKRKAGIERLMILKIWPFPQSQ